MPRIFTGTPHRGKDYGFFGLMRLVRPDLFNPEGDKIEQLSQLSKVMIRNNKATVTDLQGRGFLSQSAFTVASTSMTQKRAIFTGRLVSSFSMAERMPQPLTAVRRPLECLCSSHS